MFGRKKKPTPQYDAETQEPVLKRSICTGETTAGFKDRKTGRYTEYMLIRCQHDLDEFMQTYGIESVPKTEY